LYGNIISDNNSQHTSLRQFFFVGDGVLAIVKSAVSQGPYMLLPCIALSIRFLFAKFKEGCGNVSNQVTDMSHPIKIFTEL